MGHTVPKPESLVAIPVPAALRHAAARRLVSQANPDLDDAARRLIAAGPKHGIDFDLCWVVPDEAGTGVRQAALAVRGAGRTAMIFLSEPRPDVAEDPIRGRRDRAACLHAACDFFAQREPDRVHVAQLLPEPGEVWTIESAADAGFTHVGDLSYMRREGRRGRKETREYTPADAGPWPQGIDIRCVTEFGDDTAGGRGQRDQVLLEALESTYAETLDCPELCGMRETPDVLESHRSTGEYDPTNWWMVLRAGKPRGCMLLSRCPDQQAFELVYLGLAPEVRGLGLGTRLLRFGIERCRRLKSSWGVICAVDERNTPALRLYTGLEFEAIARRVALVRPVRLPRTGARS